MDLSSKLRKFMAKQGGRGGFFLKALVWLPHQEQSAQDEVVQPSFSLLKLEQSQLMMESS